MTIMEGVVLTVSAAVAAPVANRAAYVLAFSPRPAVSPRCRRSSARIDWRPDHRG